MAINMLPKEVGTGVWFILFYVLSHLFKTYPFFKWVGIQSW